MRPFEAIWWTRRSDDHGLFYGVTEEALENKDVLIKLIDLQYLRALLRPSNKDTVSKIPHSTVAE
jgi:hypothetical protein